MAYSIIQRGVDPTKVYAVLGGLNALEQAGLPVLAQDASSLEAPVTAQAELLRATETPLASVPSISPVKQVQRISATDAKALLDKGAALLYDVRVREAYQAKHIVGAISFPEKELTALLGTLPEDKILILYCT